MEALLVLLGGAVSIITVLVTQTMEHSAQRKSEETRILREKIEAVGLLASEVSACCQMALRVPLDAMKDGFDPTQTLFAFFEKVPLQRLQMLIQIYMPRCVPELNDLTEKFTAYRSSMIDALRFKFVEAKDDDGHAAYKERAIGLTDSAGAVSHAARALIAAAVLNYSSSTTSLQK